MVSMARTCATCALKVAFSPFERTGTTFLEEDLLKAARKLAENKKLESKLDYSKV